MNIPQLYHTLKPLKFKQFYYRLYYLLRSVKRRFLPVNYWKDLPCFSNDLYLKKSITPKKIFVANSFVFLNKKVLFDKDIDWNYNENGKLWCYNLNYFEFLLQDDCTKEQGLVWIKHHIKSFTSLKDGLEPYPLSLKGINWIKFLTKYTVNDAVVNLALLQQFNILIDHLEYHLLGNHLLENGFSLLFAAYYFKDDLFYKKAKKIVKEALEVQILADGAHFELTPMYHKIIFFRLLDVYNLVKNNAQFNKELEPLLKGKAKKMLGHLKSISFKNGTVPHFNDTTNGIAPTTNALIKYANSLGVYQEALALKECGYRKFQTDCYELFADVAGIEPDHIPGHAHADTFNFVLNVNNKPLIVDTGISTYEKNGLRQRERMTSSHNTVSIADCSSSDVWSGFRVGRKAKVVVLEDTATRLLARHDGYLYRFNTVHQREFYVEKKQVLIKDVLLSEQEIEGCFYMHFNHDITVHIEGNTVFLDACTINFSAISSVKLLRYNQAIGFNKIKEATAVVVVFKKEMQTQFIF